MHFQSHRSPFMPEPCDLPSTQPLISIDLFSALVNQPPRDLLNWLATQCPQRHVCADGSEYTAAHHLLFYLQDRHPSRYNANQALQLCALALSSQASRLPPYAPTDIAFRDIRHHLALDAALNREFGQTYDVSDALITACNHLSARQHASQGAPR